MIGLYPILVAREIWSRPTVKTITKLSPKEERTIGSLQDIADQNGVGEAFAKVLSIGIENFLYLRFSKGSIMYTPQSNKNRCLFTVWVNPLEGLLRVYVATSAFPEFYNISETVAVEIFGAQGWYSMPTEDTSNFSVAVSKALSEN